MSLHLRGLAGRAASPPKPASGGPALVVTHLRDALLLAPPLPWLRPAMPRILLRTSEPAHQVPVNVAIVGPAAAGKKDAQLETEALTAAKAHLDAGRSLRTLNPEAEQRALLLGVFPVTLKPAVYVANAAEELLPGGGDPAAKVTRLGASESTPAI